MPIELNVPDLRREGIVAPDLSDTSSPIVGQRLNFRSSPASAFFVDASTADTVAVTALTGPRSATSMTMVGAFPSKLTFEDLAASMNPAPIVNAWFRGAEPSLIEAATVTQSGATSGAIYVLNFSGADKPTAKEAAETLTLGDVFKEENRIQLASYNDDINAGDGDDEVRAGGGRDMILGGDGDDTLLGQNGNDTLKGGDGDDSLRGGSGRDSLDGDDGDDVLRGDGGRDELRGGDGDDELFGGGGKDTLRGGEGDDTLTGNGGGDLLVAQEGKDQLTGGGGSDSFVFEFTPGDGTNDRFTALDFNNGETDLIGVVGAPAGVEYEEFIEENVSYQAGKGRMVIKVGEDRAFVNGLETEDDYNIALVSMFLVDSI